MAPEKCPLPKNTEMVPLGLSRVQILNAVCQEKLTFSAIENSTDSSSLIHTGKVIFKYKLLKAFGLAVKKQTKTKIYSLYLPVIFVNIICNLFNYTKCI